VALRDEASKPAYVETVPKQGYRFIALVTGPEPQEAEHSIENAGTELAVALGPRVWWGRGCYFRRAACQFDTTVSFSPES